MSDELRHGRPKLVYECDPGDEDEDEPLGLTRIRDWQNYKEAPPVHGWRRQHALASMRAMLGTLAFVAFGVRHGEQLRNLTSNEPGAREREYERANAWAEQVNRQRGIEWCPRCWSHEVESTTVGYAPDSDRNKRTCRLCGHEWRP